MTSRGPYRIGAKCAETPGETSAGREAYPFRFNGRALEGRPGDTLAAALLANGVRVVGRSFKFHRPRGVFSAGVEEPNAFVQLGIGEGTIPSARATQVELREGLEAFVPSGWPSLGWDLGRVFDFTAPLWAAGFYNKTFIRPNWHAYECLIRRMAGFGTAPPKPDPDRYESQNLHCDVLVVGGGVAGLRAAIAAAQGGSSVVLVEQGAELGGRALWNGLQVDSIPAETWARSTTDRLSPFEELRILRRTTAVGCYGHGLVTLIESLPDHDRAPGTLRERYWLVRAKRVVLATGAIEQPLVYCNNDRPGIVLAGAAHEYLRRHAVAIGRRVVIATNNDSAYALAGDLTEAGVNVLGVTDTRHEVPQALANKVCALGIPHFIGSMPIDTYGFGALAGVCIGRLSRNGLQVESLHRFACDALAVSGGWNPSLQLFGQAGGKLSYDERSGALEPTDTHPVIEVVTTARPLSIGPRVSPVGSTQRQWVDLRHDVTVADLELAIRENFHSLEHVKRYTTVGMAADQGKTSNVLALEIVARLRGKKPSELGHTTFRPPFIPVTLGAIAGRAIGGHFAPHRRTPIHDWHSGNGAELEYYGDWKRPSLYLGPNETRVAAIEREARAVRTAAGLFDASTLGKIEVQGPDALEFLDRFYINDLKTLKPGRARYGLMLQETGILFDDGTVVMLAPDHLLLTTTSGNAERVATWLEEWHQCEWPALRLAITPVTDQWATITLAGPRAREILWRVDTDIDFSASAFPHLEFREGRILGEPARVYRVSFTGEVSYEINVQAAAAQALWDALRVAGRPLGLQPFGLKALMRLRLEKGFLHLGSDTDGTTIPDDVGWGAVAEKKKADYIGKRSLRLPEHLRPDRRQFVGLRSESEVAVGSHLRLDGSTEKTDGWVTSAGVTVLGGEPIALAVLRSGRRRLGENVSVHDMGSVTGATVVEPMFYDPKGERMHA